MAEAKRDNNQVTTITGTSSDDGVTPVVVLADPTTHELIAKGESTRNEVNLPQTVADNADIYAIWSDVNNVKIDDSNYASVSLAATGNQSNGLLCTNFGFSIPTDVTIEGIIASYEAKKGALGAGRVSFLGLIKGGVFQDDLAKLKFQSEAFTTSDVVYTAGAMDNLWANTWTVDDINANNFGVGLVALSSSDAVDININYVTLTVYYSDSTFSYDTADRDENGVPVAMGVSSADGVTPVPIYADPVTGSILIKSL